MNLCDITMNKSNQRKLRSVRIKCELDQHLENMANRENRSVNNLIETLLAKASDFRAPNQDTKESIQEAMEEKPYQKRYTDLNTFFDDLAK